MPTSFLIFRTPEDLNILRGVVGHSAADAEISVSGEPPLGAIVLRGRSIKQLRRLQTLYAAHPNFSHQTNAERLKAGLLIELLKRQITGRYYRSQQPEKSAKLNHSYWNRTGEQPKGPDADVAHAYMEERGFKHCFRAVRRAYGPGVVGVAAAEAVYEGLDYYHFGFRDEATSRAAWKRMDDYRVEVEREEANRPWQLIVAGLEHEGRRRWLIVAAGAFILSEYTMTMPDGTLLGAASLRFDTRGEVHAAALAIHSTPEHRPEMKLLMMGPGGMHGELIAPDITAKVTLPDAPSMTMVEYFNSNAEWFFTFMDPISKLSFKGHTASFADPSAFEDQLVQLIITDALDGVWLPHASKVFLMGWRFFDHGDFRAKAQEAAGVDLTNAYGLNNLRSPVAAKRLLEEYRRLLETATSEATLQTFLESHPEFVYPEHAQLISKPSLGGEREPDFAFSIGSAFGPRWVFVEIERPDKQIFTKAQNFQFSHQFTQAKGQLLQWDTLITQDHPYFSRRFQGLQKPEFHLVYGRDSELDESRRQMLAAEFSAAANRTFSTFDDLANRFETIVNRIFPAIP